MARSLGVRRGVSEYHRSIGVSLEYRSTTGVLEGVIESMNNVHCRKLFSIMHCPSQMLSAAGNRSSSSGQAVSSHFYLWSRVLAIRNARKLLSLAVLSTLRKEKKKRSNEQRGSCSSYCLFRVSNEIDSH